MRRIYIFLFLLLFLFAACENCADKKEKANNLISGLEKYHNINGFYPDSLNYIEKTTFDKNTINLEWNYFLDPDGPFNLEIKCYSDIYWYNSSNGYWDYLEGNDFNKQSTRMKKILTDLFLNSINSKDSNYTSEQLENNWIGNPPATEKEISAAESRLKVTLPEDYKEFLLIANGYPTYNDAVEPSFEKVNNIEYLKDFDNEVIEIWKENGNKEIAEALSKSIIIAGKQEEQWFLLIPPQEKSEKWRYWKFASWIPGEIEYKNLKDYFLDSSKEI
ncbi:SMI1/KNR4 family protein [Mangrovivirga sp. M17]|uniref:SMI1/KNR4 family protein n=1 Tax=Mangrovivirga halotolerans TaxID=2993936 RepID=A0ABT3RP24_9BACT|nr:SMI1/KNR4 family protein [Mangrovivirga halotolerans]MCX2743355.1 SMI1/KNR4 family protein [Mangrovivirga halotolerans]